VDATGKVLWSDTRRRGSLFAGFRSAAREVIKELKGAWKSRINNKSKGEAVANWCTTEEFVKGGPWSAALQSGFRRLAPARSREADMSRLRLKTALVMGAAISLVCGLTAQASQVQQAVSPAVKHDVSLPLREMAAMALVTGEEKGLGELDEESYARRLAVKKVGEPVEDLIVQRSQPKKLVTTPGLSFDGVPGVSYKVPDTNGAVGATQYVQWVNTRYAVYNKTTGKKVLGPVAGNAFWQGFGGPCQSTNDGDIIALYDKAAARWVMMHRADNAPYLECVAVSITSDATGGYYRYAFANPFNNFFTDYVKLGVWPDGYYFSTDLQNASNHFNFMGTMVCAFDRNNMLLGNAATEQCFQAANTAIHSFLPSDVDGLTSPPRGSPNYFVNLDPANNALDLWQFHVDWTVSGNSTFTGPTIIPVTHFNEACLGGVCVPQLNSTQLLDSLGDRVMYRLSYRNFGSYESLLVTHSVNTKSSVGVRWYEIRNPEGTPPTLYQQGTYTPDSNFRWMPSIAQDKVGNIAVGYSVSGNSMYPAIRYTGRLPSDPLGTMQSENSILEGTGAELPGNGRWGDYSAMTVDPLDDCTFWYTNEYYSVSSLRNWRTRIASFKFPSCQ